MGTTVIRDKKYHDEMKQLKACPHIFGMVSDLLSLGETYESIKNAENFKTLNARYRQLTGKTPMRLGSIKEAVLEIYPIHEGVEQ